MGVLPQKWSTPATPERTREREIHATFSEPRAAPAPFEDAVPGESVTRGTAVCRLATTLQFAHRVIHPATPPSPPPPRPCPHLSLAASENPLH